MQPTQCPHPTRSGLRPVIASIDTSHYACGHAGKHSPSKIACTAAAPPDGDTVPISSSGGASGTQPITESPTERRIRESRQVEERVQYIYNLEDWQRESAEVSRRWPAQVAHALLRRCKMLVCGRHVPPHVTTLDPSAITSSPVSPKAACRRACWRKHLCHATCVH